MLPVGWKRMRLGDIAERVTKGTTPTTYGHRFTTSGIRFVKVENLRSGRINRGSIDAFISEETDRAQARSSLREGDVLFSIAGTIGRTAIVQGDDVPANTNQALAIIRGTGQSVRPEYLVIALQSALQQTAADAARGSGMNNISLDDIRRFEVSLPPEREQREIVKRVRRLLRLVEGTGKRLDAVGLLVERLSAAALVSAIGDRWQMDVRARDA